MIILPEMLPALACDEVAAAVLDDGLEALGAALGVGEHPLDVLALAAALGLPARPHGARARRVRRRRAPEAEAGAAGALHLAHRRLAVGGGQPHRAAAVRDAGAPLHRAVVVHVRPEEQVVEPLRRGGVPPAEEAPHHVLVADGGALERHAPDLLVAAVEGGDEGARPAVVAEGVPAVHDPEGARGGVLEAHLAGHLLSRGSTPPLSGGSCWWNHAVALLLQHDACLHEHPVLPFPLQVVVEAICVPTVVDQESTRVVLLYVEHVHHHGQVLLLQIDRVDK